MIRKSLIGTMFLVLPVWPLAAGSAHAGESSPAEKLETQQLNIEALQAARGDQSNAAMPTATVQPSTSNEQVHSGMLSEAVNLPPVIANANVVSREGETIGLVQRIQLDATGKPVTVDVAVKGTDKTVSLDARNLSYDAMDNIVVASRSSAEIRSMPGKYQQG